MARAPRQQSHSFISLKGKLDTALSRYPRECGENASADVCFACSFPSSLMSICPTVWQSYDPYYICLIEWVQSFKMTDKTFKISWTNHPIVPSTEAPTIPGRAMYQLRKGRPLYEPDCSGPSNPLECCTWTTAPGNHRTLGEAGLCQEGAHRDAIFSPLTTDFIRPIYTQTHLRYPG